MSLLDKLQQAWQSQRCAAPPMNPDALLKGVRLERQVAFWADIFIIAVLAGVGASMSRFASGNIGKNWPWLIYVASDVWVIGFILFNRWRRRRHAAHYDQPLLAHVEWSIQDIEHRMWQDRYSLWWYILPLALGCMIPPIFFFGMEYGKRPLSSSLSPLLVAEGVFLAVFTVVHLVMRYGQRVSNEKRRRELDALRALRESLLNTEK
jgi:CDP-diglyceride synthetase